jgi:hypothetical protein
VLALKYIVLAKDRARTSVQFCMKRVIVDDSDMPTSHRSVVRVADSVHSDRSSHTMSEYDGDNGEAIILLLNREHTTRSSVLRTTHSYRSGREMDA